MIVNGKNYEKTKIISFNSIEEMQLHHKEFQPYLAIVNNIRFRDSFTLYPEIYPEYQNKEFKIKRNEFMIQDRFGSDKKWAIAYDKTPRLLGLRKLIPQIFSDMEVMDFVYGEYHFGATFSGPYNYFDVYGYNRTNTQQV